MKPVICRNTYMIYKGTNLAVVSATSFEISYLKRYIAEKDLKVAIARLNTNKLSKAAKAREITFEEFLESNKLTFRVGRLVHEDDQHQQHNKYFILLVLILQLLAVITLALIAL